MKHPITHHVRLVKYSDAGNYPYTHAGIQQMIRDLLDTYGISQFELSKRAGLTPAAIYQILKKKPKQVSRPPRKSTVQGLAKAVGATVRFNGQTNIVSLFRTDFPETKDDSITQFLLQVADAVKQSGRTEIPRDERDKILRVIRVLL